MFSTSLSRRPAVALFVLLSSVSIPITAQSVPPREGSPAVAKPSTVEHGVPLRTAAPNAAPSNPGSILGDTIEIEYRYPTMQSVYDFVMTSGIVTPEGVRLDLFNNDEIIVFPDSVDLIDINPGTLFQDAAFNGISVKDITNPRAFIGALIGVKGNLAGLSTSNVSELDSLLYVNYEGIQTPAEGFGSVRFFVFSQDGAAAKEPEDGN